MVHDDEFVSFCPHFVFGLQWLFSFLLFRIGIQYILRDARILFLNFQLRFNSAGKIPRYYYVLVIVFCFWWSFSVHVVVPRHGTALNNKQQQQQEESNSKQQQQS